MYTLYLRHLATVALGPEADMIYVDAIAIRPHFGPSVRRDRGAQLVHPRRRRGRAPTNSDFTVGCDDSGSLATESGDLIWCATMSSSRDALDPFECSDVLSAS